MFKLSGFSFAAGELVFHDHLREFGTVEGIESDSGRLLVNFPGLPDYKGSPELLRTGAAVADAKAYAEQLQQVAPSLADWFLEEYAGGADLEDCREALQAATPARVVAIVEGGILQHILTDSRAAVECVTVDYDVEGTPDSETVAVPQGDGTTERASVSDPYAAARRGEFVKGAFDRFGGER